MHAWIRPYSQFERSINFGVRDSMQRKLPVFAETRWSCERLAVSPVGSADVRLTNPTVSRYTTVFTHLKALAVNQTSIVLPTNTHHAPTVALSAQIHSKDTQPHHCSSKLSRRFPKIISTHKIQCTVHEYYTGILHT